MFHIISRIKSLFSRPRIRGAICEYRPILIQYIQNNLETLHKKAKVGFMIMLHMCLNIGSTRPCDYFNFN